MEKEESYRESVKTPEEEKELSSVKDYKNKLSGGFEQLDDKTKSRIILGFAIVILLLGLYFMYTAISGLLS